MRGKREGKKNCELNAQTSRHLEKERGDEMLNL